MVLRNRVLLLEDDTFLAPLVLGLLQRNACEVLHVPNCAEALSIEGEFDVGVFDVELPDGSGIDAAEALLCRGVVCAAVFFSGAGDEPTVCRAENLGEFVGKTQGSGPLMSAVRRAVQRSLATRVVAVEATSPNSK